MGGVAIERNPLPLTGWRHCVAMATGWGAADWSGLRQVAVPLGGSRGFAETDACL